ncbi:GNAT family N-acetyltransferase [Candidatus Poribacteria bacterium]|nr:GNAT family N-acetyltransferase [Candidatus Poribacteria bacterium]
MDKNELYKKKLGDKLVLKTAANEEDIRRIADCDTEVFGKDECVDELCIKLFTKHPKTNIDDLIYIEDEKTGQVVSTLCLIPWKWKYEDVIIDVGELGIVGTRKPYRRKGLIRAQVDYFKEKLNQREFDISKIQGIPYFYRQFDYEYTIPLEGGYDIELHQIPGLKEDEDPKYNIRREKRSDLPVLEGLYNQAACKLQIYACRDGDIWNYLYENSDNNHIGFDSWVVEDSESNIVGYFRVKRRGFTQGLIVYEVSKLNYDMSLDVLRYLKNLAEERNKPNIRLNLPDDSTLVKIANYHGGRDVGHYAWQIHIPNMTRFIRKISPVLEKRIAQSPFAGLTEDVLMNLYIETIAIIFDNGKIVKVESRGPSDGPMRIPPRAATMMVLGYCCREELEPNWPDIWMPPRYQYITDIFFPRMRSHIYTIY